MFISRKELEEIRNKIHELNYITTKESSPYFLSTTTLLDRHNRCMTKLECIELKLDALVSYLGLKTEFVREISSTIGEHFKVSKIKKKGWK